MNFKRPYGTSIQAKLYLFYKTTNDWIVGDHIIRPFGDCDAYFEN